MSILKNATTPEFLAVLELEGFGTKGYVYVLGRD